MTTNKPVIINKDLTPFLQSGAGFSLAAKILNKLSQSGYKAYLAGGCVRDALLNRPFKDIDIVTEALPEQVEQLFAGFTIPVGKKFGIIIVHESGVQIEVATFRKDGDYEDGRRPENVKFSDEKEDALRRDFTINALFYDPIKFQIIDYVGGIADLSNKIIKTVGDSETRFSEDYLRVLRLFRFAETLNFKMDPKTFQSAQNHLKDLAKVSDERKREELLKSFYAVSDQYALAQKYQSYGLWEVFFHKSSILLQSELFKVKHFEEIPLLCALLWNELSYKEVLKNLKLSQKTSQFVSKALVFKSKLGTILKASESEKRFYCLQAEFVLSLKFMLLIESKDIVQTQELERLNRLSLQYQQQPPKALLTGEDLIKYFQGKELGNALDLVFKEQLVQNWQNKEQAINWILQTKK
jgi:tRNA nucleotidyltransferase (CCA-adding enzyme)